MLVVKDVTIIETEQNRWEILNTPEWFLGKDITKEMIQGQSFVNANGEEICIGISKQAQKALGLPFEAFENMNNTVENLNQYINAQLVIIRQHETMSFWSRIKFLFNRQSV